MFQVFAIYNTFDLYAQVLIIILKPETLNKDVMILMPYALSSHERTNPFFEYLP